jgi:ribonuclease HI
LYRGFSTQKEAKEFLLTGGHDGQKHTKRIPRSTPNEALVGEPEGLISIYTDGGCINNPGPGGYGAVIIDGKKRTELSGGFRLTTNNRMELMACIVALRALKKMTKAVLTSDSRYVINGIQKGWAKKWRTRNWMRDKTHRAENSDLWAELLDILERHDVAFQWVRGHTGHPENERCDAMAKDAARLPGLPPDTGYEKTGRGSSQGPRLFD